MAAHYSGPQVVAITVSFTSIAAAIVLLRLFTRFVLIRNAGSEDYCITFAMSCSIVLTVMICEQVKYGMGQHIWNLDEETIVKSLKPFWASIVIYYLSLTFTKVSILLQYFRIFPDKRFRFVCWCTMGVVGAYGLWTFFASVFECTPVEYFWNKTIPGGHCMNQYAVWFTNASINIVTDIAIVILPIPCLRSLNLPVRQKRVLMLVFALGGFVCIVSILRLQSLVAISNSTDPTWDNPPAATWSCIETNVGIMCACLPSLRPLLSRISPGIFSTNRPAHSYEAGYYRSGGGHVRSNRVNLSGTKSSKATFTKTESSEEIIGVQPTVVGTECTDDYELQNRSGKSGNGRYFHKSGASADVTNKRLSISDKRTLEENEIRVVTVLEQSVERKTSAPVSQPPCQSSLPHPRSPTPHSQGDFHPPSHSAEAHPPNDSDGHSVGERSQGDASERCLWEQGV